MSFWTFILGLVFGVFAGQRLMLARQRLAGARRTLQHAAGADSLVQLFSSTMEKRAQAQATGLVNHVRVINAIQFVAVWNWDLRELLHLGDEIGEIQSLELGWRRKLLARMLALTVYESLTKIEEFFNPDWDRKWSLRRALDKLGVGTQLKPRLDETYSKIEAALSPHRDLLAGIRDNVIAHKDQDVATQIEWLKQTDVDELQRLGYDMLALTTVILSVLTDVVSSLPRPTVG